MEQLPLYQQIYNTIKSKIETGAYAPGELLPSEKELADQYHVSRITSKKAMHMLAEGEYVIRMRGKGSFVAERLPKPAAKETEGGLPEPAGRAGALTGLKLVGVILDGFSPSFGCRMLGGILGGCEAGGYSAVLRCSGGSLKKETMAIEELAALGVCGFIIMCVHDENYNERILQLVIEHVPVVTLDRRLKGIPVPFVGTDNVMAAKELTTGLLDRGYRKIGFIRPSAQDTSTLLDRQRGFQLAFHDYGLLEDESLWLTNLRSTLPGTSDKNALNQDIAIINEYLTDHPDTEAFLASEYGLARLLDDCMKKAGREAGKAIVCFDGPSSLLSGSEFVHVSQGEEEIGRLGAELLLRLIGGEKIHEAALVPYRICL